MRDILLVAGREIRQIVATTGFWVTLLALPLAIAVSIFASIALAPSPSVGFALFDASGRYGPMIEQRLELDYQRQVLRDLATYVDRWKLTSVDPSAPWARRDSWLSDSEIGRFVELGGADAALRKLGPYQLDGAPAFDMPDRPFYRVSPPGDVPVNGGVDAVGKAIAPFLKNKVVTPAVEVPLALAIYIPRDFGMPGVSAHVWTDGRSNSSLLSKVREELTAGMRLGILQANGMSAGTAAQVQSVNAPMAITEPPAGEERSVYATESIIPITLVYLLLITAITTGSMMLQGLVEERSNKLLESVLACIRPAALMNGKLLGLGGVGLGIVVVWVGCAVAAALFSTGSFIDEARASYEALDEPWMAPAMIFYFLTGYLTLSMLFLAIGSLSDSMQDAQSYLTPVLVVVMLPVMVMMQASLVGPESLVPQILSWIPLYTPFAMLARLGTGVSLAEVVGTGVLLLAFIAVELWLLGRLFQANLLNTGKPRLLRVLAKRRPGQSCGVGSK